METLKKFLLCLSELKVPLESMNALVFLGNFQRFSLVWIGPKKERDKTFEEGTNYGDKLLVNKIYRGLQSVEQLHLSAPVQTQLNSMSWRH